MSLSARSILRMVAVVAVVIVVGLYWVTRTTLERSAETQAKYAELAEIMLELLRTESALAQSEVAGRRYQSRVFDLLPANLEAIAMHANDNGWPVLARLARESSEVVLQWETLSQSAQSQEALHYLRVQALLSVGRVQDEAVESARAQVAELQAAYRQVAFAYAASIAAVSAVLFLVLWLQFHLFVRPLSSMRERIEGGLAAWPATIALPLSTEVHQLAQAYDDSRRDLLVSERRMRAVFEQAAVGVDLLDPNGQYLAANRKLCEICGYSESELIAMGGPGAITLEEDRELQVKLQRRLAARELEHYSIEKRYRRKDGSLIWVGVAVAAVRDDDGRILFEIGIVQDISSRVEAEQSLKDTLQSLERRVAERTADLAAANERLRELDRLKSMFIASMSHELRTPLNSVIGFAGLMLMRTDGPLNEIQEDYVRRIKASGKHLLELISDVIDVSRIDAGFVEANVESFDLSELIDDAVALVGPQASARGLRIECSERPAVQLRTDRKRLLQCLLNYLSNAVKYSDAGAIRLDAQVRDGNLRIAVSDRGIGIAAADRARLFLQFSRIDSPQNRKTPGTGLGLYLTRRLVRQVLRGTVGVESEPGKGSTFWLNIPIEVSDEETVDH